MNRLAYLVLFLLVTISINISAQLFTRTAEIKEPSGLERGFGGIVAGVDFDQDGMPEIYACNCLLYTSDAADERSSVDLGGRRIIKKKNKRKKRFCKYSNYFNRQQNHANITNLYTPNIYIQIPTTQTDRITQILREKIPRQSQ